MHVWHHHRTVNRVQQYIFQYLQISLSWLLLWLQSLFLSQQLAFAASGSLWARWWTPLQDDLSVFSSDAKREEVLPSQMRSGFSRLIISRLLNTKVYIIFFFFPKWILKNTAYKTICLDKPGQTSHPLGLHNSLEI